MWESRVSLALYIVSWMPLGVAPLSSLSSSPLAPQVPEISARTLSPGPLAQDNTSPEYDFNLDKAVISVGNASDYSNSEFFFNGTRYDDSFANGLKDWHTELSTNIQRRT